MTRKVAVSEFLRDAGWGNARVSHLAGDASARRYERVMRTETGDSAILMDAAPDLGVPTRPFVEVARLLSGWGASTPQILAWDEARGLMLIEDFGDALLARILETDPAQEEALYSAAVDTLIALHRRGVPAGFPVYTHEDMAGRAALSALWYLPGTGQAEDPDGAAQIERLTLRLLRSLAPEYAVVALRDYHAENLVWLPDREGSRRIGLLDFQDAMAGHPAYDLISLVEDARRDVSAEVRNAMIARYLDRTRLPEEPFRAACAILAAQRNLRILGVFARLCLHYGKPHYVDLIPRVWDHLLRDLEHPALVDLAATVSAVLPEPTQVRLRKLKEARGTWPMR